MRSKLILLPSLIRWSWYGSAFRDVVRYQMSCFFIKFINGLWPPPLRFIKLDAIFFEHFFGFFFHWIWFLDIQNRFYFILKKAKNHFWYASEDLQKALQNMQNSPSFFFIKRNDPPSPRFWNFIKKTGNLVLDGFPKKLCSLV